MALLEGFLKNCKIAPSQSALTEQKRSLSYEELNRNAALLAYRLKCNGVSTRDRVVIALDRGVDAVIAILATLYQGGCYVPLDLKNPAQRLAFIIDDVQPKIVIGNGIRPAWCATSHSWLNITEPGAQRTETVTPVHSDPEDLAAILYTSGSTGKPKGVVLSHKALQSFADWAGQTFSVGSGQRIASLAPFFFDLSIFDIFTSLNRAAEICFVPANTTLAPSKLSDWLATQEISIWYTVPSLLGFLALKGNLENTPLPNLKTIMFAGEVFPTPKLLLLMEQLPHIDFFNLYGPTETNVCTYWPVDQARLVEDDAIPIGYSACNAQLKIDASNNELLVKSDTLLTGYWDKSKIFTAVDDAGWYRTGDKVSQSLSGEYFYHGRLDRMIKCSGYRIEPAEIEANIKNISGVLDCAVVGVADQTSGQRPAAALVLEPTAEITRIRQSIRQTLSGYMQPTRLSVLPKLPCLSNGKLDYQAISNHLIHS